MSSVNKATILGHLGADPEVRTTASGQMVANMRIATSRQWTDKAGQRQEKTTWHTVVAWGKLAELAQRFLAKGRQVYVEGEIDVREYEARDGGGKRYATEIIARELVFLGGREQGRSDEAPQRGRPPAPQQAPASEPADPDFYDDAVPF